jgi:succinate dehydrogenase/fumarate reductase flavoprotein subunit
VEEESVDVAVVVVVVVVVGGGVAGMSTLMAAGNWRADGAISALTNSTDVEETESSWRGEKVRVRRVRRRASENKTVRENRQRVNGDLCGGACVVRWWWLGWWRW